MKRVLITGATGFVGHPCPALLASRGYEVHATTSRPPRTDDGIHWHQTDLLQPGAADALLADLRPTHLLHLAWYAEHGKFWQAPENLPWVRASLELVEAFVRHGGRRAVVAGTCAEYEWGHDRCHEATTPLHPASYYGQCKHALEQVLAGYAAQTGLSLAWGRIFLLYGPQEHPTRLVASVIQALLQGEPARTSHGGQLRDLLHVADVAAAFAALLDSTVTGPVNVGSGQGVTLKQVIETLGRLTGRPDLIQLGALPAPADDPPFLVADTRRLTDEVGWTPQFSLEDGLQDAIAWWRQQANRAVGFAAGTPGHAP